MPPLRSYQASKHAATLTGTPVDLAVAHHVCVPDIAGVSEISSTCVYLYSHFFKHVYTYIYFHYAVYVLVFNAHNLLGSLCMGNNAILYPIKLIGSCIQLR